MFPRHYIVVYEQDDELVEYALFFNGLKCSLAHKRVQREQPNGFHYLYKEDGSYRGFEAKRAPFRMLRGCIFETTFHSLTEEWFRKNASTALPYEVLRSAAVYENHYIRNSGSARAESFKRKYLWSFRDFFPSR